MILLVKPYSFSLTQHPPLGLGYLSSILATQKRQTKIIDFQFPDHQQAFLHYLNIEPIDWIGISVSVQNISHTRFLINTLKLYKPQIPVIVGGTYPSTLPDLCLKELNADIAVIGEGEETVLELDCALMNNSVLQDIPGLVYRQDRQIKKTALRQLCMNLDLLPIPDYEQIPPRRYSRVPWQVFKKGRVIGPILTTRGCPFNCSFCAAACIMGKKIRKRSIELVGEEMELLHRNFGVDEFHVVDENIVSSREHAAAFCEEILKRNLKIHWKTPNGVRSEFLDCDLLSLMKRSGCYMLGFGIESGNPKILKNVSKSLDLESALGKIRMAGEAGIITFGYFIIGLPGDTKETIQQTIQVAVNSKMDLAHFSFCIPYPGSRIYNELGPMEQQRVVKQAWHFVPWPQNNLTTSELSRLHRKAYFMFYLRLQKFIFLMKLALRSDFFAFARTVSYYLLHKKIRRSFHPPEPFARIFAARFFTLFVTRIRKIIEGGFTPDKKIVAKFLKQTNGKCLDIGCGEGLFADLFAPNQYLGVDNSPTWLTAAQIKNPARTFLYADLTERINISGPFDMILVSKILHHLNDDKAHTLIRQATKILSKKGIMLILEPVPPCESGNWFHNFICKMETGKFHRSIRGLETLLPETLRIRETGIYKTLPMAFYYMAIEWENGTSEK